MREASGARVHEEELFLDADREGGGGTEGVQEVLTLQG
jgi:hypothetical protein